MVPSIMKLKGDPLRREDVETHQLVGNAAPGVPHERVWLPRNPLAAQPGGSQGDAMVFI